jgi:hypothetical protein
MATGSLQARFSPRAAVMLGANGSNGSNPLGGTTRLANLLSQLEAKLAERYAFDVFAKDAINFGILTTYRQTWEPQQYQVGDLVKTIPMAPKEIVRYTTRSVTKRSRAQKELDDNVQTRKTEAADTTRAEEEIVNKAVQKTNFNLSATETFGGEGMSISATESGGGSTENESAKTKKDFRESVLKSAQEYRQQHKVELEVAESTETEETTFHEIQNPNDELAVTYLFYELQRTYKISEKLYKLTPVILVANQVPAPNEIDDAWLVEHDWILNRVILDDSFKAALDYLTKSFVGAEINIKVLEANAKTHKELVDRLGQQIQVQMGILAANEKSVDAAVGGLVQSQQTEGALNFVKRIFDPIGITGGAGTGQTEAAQAMVDYAKETLDRATRERARLVSQMEVASTALQAAVDKLSNAVKEHYDRVAQIDRLRVHVKENILYYMQATWRQEPPDQRYFRLYNLDVPVVTALPAAGQAAPVGGNPRGGALAAMNAALGNGTYTVTLPKPALDVKVRKLSEIADIDNVLAYKGNYMVFALKENNYITWQMMQDYVQVGDELLLHDPDESGNYSIDDLQKLATSVYKKDPTRFEAMKDDFKQMLIDRLTSTRKDNELVIVPTSSLYIECLVGTHPLLEDFKLIHRALDVKKVQAEVRHAELENVRLAARALKGKDEDPDIEKKIVVENAESLVIDTE